MTRLIVPLLLALAFLGCSANRSQEADDCYCQQGCSLQLVKLNRNLDKLAMVNFEHNLPELKEQTFGAVTHADDLIRYSYYMDTPDPLFMRSLVSLKQLEAFRQQHQIGYDNARQELKTYITDWEKYRCTCGGRDRDRQDLCR
jgi:hypothetical protein